MSETQPYVAANGTAVPSAVAAEFAAPTSDAWDTLRRGSPDNVPVFECIGYTLFSGVTPDGTRVYVSERGDTYHPVDYEHVTHVRDNYTSCMDTPFTFHDGINVVHHDHRSGHLTVVTVVFGDGETFRLHSSSGVVYGDYRDGGTAPRDTPETVRQLAVALSDTAAPTAHDPDTSSTVPDVPDGIERWASGSHRTDRATQTSERWNALVSGDVPPSWDDDSIVALVNNSTRNICHRSLTAYANEAGRVTLERIFDTDEQKSGFP